MASFRAQRLAEMIHREISVRLRSEIKEPGVSSISITRVQVTPDLSRADVSYMPLGGGPVDDELQEAMDRAGRKLRGPIGRALRLRHAPELCFLQDQHTEAAVKMTRLLDRLSEERTDEQSAQTDEQSPQEETT